MLLKLYISSLLCFTCYFSSQGQLIANQNNSLVLASFGVSPIDFCAPDPDFTLTFDSTLLPIATGVELVAVITSVTFSGVVPPATTYGSINVGDTLRFDTISGYPVFLTFNSNVAWDYLAVGVPTQVGEQYPCSYSVRATLGNCNNIVELMADTSILCEVLPFNSIAEGGAAGWELYPNPAGGPVRLLHKDGLTQWKKAALHDVQGRTLRSWQQGQFLSTEGLSHGIYFLRFSALDEEYVMRLQVR